MTANKVVKIDSIPPKFVKLASILLSDRTDSHSSVIYLYIIQYLFSQNALFVLLDKFLNTLQLEKNCIIAKQSIMFENKLITYRENLNKIWSLPAASVPSNTEATSSNKVYNFLVFHR